MRGSFGFCEATLLAQDCSSVGMQFGLVRRATDGRLQVEIRVCQSLVLIGQQTEYVVRVAIVRIAIEDSVRKFGGSGSVACLVELTQPAAVPLSPFVP